MDGSLPEPYVELKGLHSARETLPSGSLAAACDRRQGRENWLHPGVPAKEAFAASPGLPVPSLPPPSASAHCRLSPRIITKLPSESATSRLGFPNNLCLVASASRASASASVSLPICVYT